jgi:hypothetical protein
LKKLAQASKSNKTKNQIFLAIRRAEWQYLGRKPEVFAFSVLIWPKVLDSGRKQAYLAPRRAIWSFRGSSAKDKPYFLLSRVHLGGVAVACFVAVCFRLSAFLMLSMSTFHPLPLANRSK